MQDEEKGELELAAERASAERAAEPAAAEVEPETEPVVLAAQKIRLTHNHGFIDENQRHRYWRAGDVIGDPVEIELLKGRGALHESAE